MIYKDRTSVAPPPELTGGDKCSGSKELKKTLDFFRLKANLQKPYDKWKAYKLPGVIKALDELFNGKCAYCESPIGATQPTDIEHFRPKGGYIVRDRVKKADEFKRPGYYWLAASWENLLPSCIDCNRERTHEFPDGNFGKVGKANKFPLAGEKSRATGPDFDLVREKRLLLDPCADAPEQHLEFAEDGTVRPAVGSDGRESRVGKVSIEVFGLRRGKLVQARHEWAILVLDQIRRVSKLEQKLGGAPGDNELLADLAYEIGRLKWYLEPSRRYSAMAHQLVRKYYGRVPG